MLPTKTNNIVRSSNLWLYRGKQILQKLLGHVIIWFSSFLKSIHAYSRSFFSHCWLSVKRSFYCTVWQVLTSLKSYRKCKAKFLSPSGSPRATLSPTRATFSPSRPLAVTMLFKQPCYSQTKMYVLDTEKKCYIQNCAIVNHVIKGMCVNFLLNDQNYITRKCYLCLALQTV